MATRMHTVIRVVSRARGQAYYQLLVTRKDELQKQAQFYEDELLRAGAPEYGTPSVMAFDTPEQQDSFISRTRRLMHEKQGEVEATHTAIELFLSLVSSEDIEVPF